MAEIGRTPLLWTKVDGHLRRRVVKRFPYSVIYLAEPEHVEVLAVFHSARDPRRWRERLQRPPRPRRGSFEFERALRSPLR
jgi:plasmid stabilization system protein ParE